MIDNQSRDTPVQFNLGLKMLEIIGGLLSQATSAYNKQDFKKWFVLMKSIKNRINNRLGSDERLILKNQEEKIDAYLKHIKKEGLDCPDENTDINSFVYHKVNPLIENYDNTLTDLLEKKGYLIPLKHDKSNLFGQEDSAFSDSEGEE